MIDYKYLDKNRERIKDSLKKRGSDFNLEKALKTGKERNDLLGKVESFRAEINSSSRDIGRLMKEGSKEEADKLKEKVSSLKRDMAESEAVLKDIESRLTRALLELPNMLHESVPEGKSEADNETVRT
jgi:seryl-tRNA synthetase